MNLKMVFNMDAPEIMLSGLQERLPVITSCFSSFAEKYPLLKQAVQLKNIVIDFTEEAFNVANNHTPDLSQVSILFRNTVVQYQRAVQVFLDAAVKVLRETRVKLPGSEETTPLIEVLNKMFTGLTTMVEKAFNLLAVNVEHATNAVIGVISKVQVTMPVGDVIAVKKLFDRIRNEIKTMPNPVVEFLKNLERPDLFLEKLGNTLKFFVDRSQDFVDVILETDVLDFIAVYMNALYDKYIIVIRTVTNYVNTAMDSEYIKSTINYMLEMFRSAVSQFKLTVIHYLEQAPDQNRPYVRVNGEKLEISI